MSLKYLVVGSGALGGTFTTLLDRAGCDVTMIARGQSYDIIKNEGFHVKKPKEEFTQKIKVKTWESYSEVPDVVILTNKGYDMDSVIPHLDRVCCADTVILPFLNCLDIGAEIKAKMKQPCTIIGGVVYVAVVREGPGRIRQEFNFCDIVIGPRRGDSMLPIIDAIRADLEATGSRVFVANNMLRAAVRKFFRVSTVSCVCCYYGQPVGPIRETEEGVQLFKDLCSELCAIADAMGEPFSPEGEEPYMGEPVEVNALRAFMSSPPHYQSSMKYDWDNGRPTEIKQQIVDVVELGRSLGLEMKAYAKVADKVMSERKP